MAAFREGKVEEGEKALGQALGIDKNYPDALYLQASALLRKKKLKEAEETLKRLQVQRDGYSVQMALSGVAKLKRDAAGVELAYQKAHEFDPSQAEPLQALVSLARKRGDKKREEEALEKLVLLAEHDGSLYQRLMEIKLADQRFEEAKRVGEQALWADIKGMRTHRLYAQALIGLKSFAEAVFELESALLCPGRPSEKALVHSELAQAYGRMGRRREAAKHQREAKKLGG